jgi:hypothetical protein
MKKALLAIMVVVALVAMSAMADAACNQTGRIFYSSQIANSSFFYIGVGNRPTFYFVYVTTTQQFINTLLNAQTSGSTVYVSGDAVLCPISGTFRNAGTVTLVTIN